jgi:NAD dependent epimerase/dehydratase family enzyme
MKIVMPGGSGRIGTLLARHFVEQGHDVVTLSRGQACALGRVVPWDAERLGDWAVELEGADVVINLAGRSVNCRYHRCNRREILASRLNSGNAPQCIGSVWLMRERTRAALWWRRQRFPNGALEGQGENAG